MTKPHLGQILRQKMKTKDFMVLKTNWNQIIVLRNEGKTLGLKEVIYEKIFIFWSTDCWDWDLSFEIKMDLKFTPRDEKMGVLGRSSRPIGQCARIQKNQLEQKSFKSWKTRRNNVTFVTALSPNYLRHPEINGAAKVIWAKKKEK